MALSRNSYDVCIYHGGCTDGIAAAWAVRHARACAFFYPGVYQRQPEPFENQRLLFVDFAYKYDVMLELAMRNEHITVLDHHKTAQEDLMRLNNECDNVTLEFDMDRCGAMMAWDHFHPTKDRPWLLEAIDAQDRWQPHRDPALITALRAHPHAPSDTLPWDALMVHWSGLMTDDGYLKLEAEARPVYNYYQQRVDDVLAKAHTICVNDGTRDWEIPAANGIYAVASDVGHALADNSVERVAAVYWVEADQSISFSLRGVDGVDTTPIAKHYGGGGHAGASGFNVDFVQGARIIFRGGSRTDTSLT